MRIYISVFVCVLRMELRFLGLKASAFNHWPANMLPDSVFTLESEDKGLEAINVLRKRTSPFLHETQTRKDAFLNISSANMEKTKHKPS